MSVYLDYAAATPVDPKVLSAMQPFFATQFFNPSALYGPAVAVAKNIDNARATVAAVLGAKASEIIFTAGGTEANNLAIHGVMQQYSEATLLVSAIEHDSVRVPAATYTHDVIPANQSGLVEPKSVAQLITDRTVLVSVMYANNEVGTVQPIKRIAAELKTIRHQRQQSGVSLPLYLHIDAAQAGNYLDLHVHRLGIDLMTLNGGKLYGPKQSGALFVKAGTNLRPQITGGGQERNLRSGTENSAGIVGFATALQLAQAQKDTEVARLRQLQSRFLQQLQTSFPEAVINGSLKYRLPNNIHVSLLGTDNERVLMALDMQDIYAAAGSACSASHVEPSAVLTAIGLDAQAIGSSIRFSMGRHTQSAEIDQVIAALQRLV